MNKTLKKNGKTPGQTFELNQAMQELTDIFERATCQFILLGETARSILKDGSVKGDKLEVGIKWTQLTQEVLSALNSVLPEKGLWIDLGDGGETPERNCGTKVFAKLRDRVKKMVFMTPNGTRVEVKVIKRKSRYLKHLDRIVYNFDDFLIPNPFDDYYKVRGFLK